MPELRRDPIVGRWVVIAPERADRPNALLRPLPEPQDAQASCPFCPGNEKMTPPEILRRGEKAWSLRVVPNRFPALRVETQLARHGNGVYDQLAGVGAHEVIIETSEHARSLSQVPPAQLVELLRVWQERIEDLSRDFRMRSIFVFKNSGVPAGATLSHAHSQLIALPVVPPELQAELDGARAHHGRKERCVFCDIVAQEQAEGARVVFQSEGALAFCPYAARSPFETWIVPRPHGSTFEAARPQELRAVADALGTVLRKLDRALEKPAFNLYLHTMPLREESNGWYHWHLELKPVLTLQAGFEWASGCFINPTPPEEAAAFLRQTEV